jgi:DNA polymerase-3 subunit alpha
MVYLKLHYPLAYFAILLTTVSNDKDKIKIAMTNAKKLNVQIIYPSIFHSKTQFVVHEQKIYYPLTGIKGISNL